MKTYLSSREWLNLFIISFLVFVSVLPSLYYLIYSYIPVFWLSESGLYETVGAVACFIAGLINLGSFRVLLNKKRRLGAVWLLLLSIGCLFIAGEEISWGQHFFDYEVSNSITSTNFQGEFNLHNSMLIQSSNNSISSVLFKLLMLYFIVLPMLLVVFPTLEQWVQQMMIPTPSMLIAVIALLARAGYTANNTIIYGSSLKSGSLRLEEGVESIFELCLLILAFESFYYVKKNIIGIGSYSSSPLPQHRTYGSVNGAWPGIIRDTSSGKSNSYQVPIGP